MFSYILCNLKSDKNVNVIIIFIVVQIDMEWSGTNINFGQDAWDDSTILDIFDNAIKSHRTKKDKVSHAFICIHLFINTYEYVHICMHIYVYTYMYI
jgi:hypothetical protein